MKQCSQCGEVKPLTGFHRCASGRLGVVAACKVCAYQRSRRRVLANATEIAAYYRAYRAKNKDRVNQHNRKWLAANKEQHAAANERWRKTNMAAAAAKLAVYRAKKFKATPLWADEFIMSEAYDLAQLRTNVMGFKWEVDHIVPLQSKVVCGLHTQDNLQVIPSRLNKSKGNHYWPDMPERMAA